MGWLSDIFGGKSKTTTTVPKYVQDAHKDAIDRAQMVADVGFMPYQGPTVAGLNDAHRASYQGFDAFARAAGMPAGAVAAMDRLPQQQEFANGWKGYSAAPMYDWAKAEFEAKYPGQAAAYNSLFIDPQTGNASTWQQTQQQQQIDQILRSVGIDPDLVRGGGDPSDRGSPGADFGGTGSVAGLSGIGFDLRDALRGASMGAPFGPLGMLLGALYGIDLPDSTSGGTASRDSGLGQKGDIGNEQGGGWGGPDDGGYGGRDGLGQDHGEVDN